jgi:NADH pyrophosphatase NudC (nudix superfamily)
MKTKGHWVIKTSAGGYWCGNPHFDPQLRKAQVYHWKEAAEVQIEVIKKRKYISSNLTFEVIAISEPKELKDTEARWISEIATLENGDHEETDILCSACGSSALNDYRGNPVDSRFCPHCGKRMINSTMPED